MLPSAGATRVYHHIVAHIERAIYDGRLAAGDKLPPERELGRRFGASRVAVREALRALEHRGLLEVRQGSCGGHFVRAVDASVVCRDFRTLLRLGRLTGSQITEARLLMEPEVARLAAERATDVDLKELQAALDERAAAVAEGRVPRDFDLDFHRRLAVAARAPVHAVAIHALMDLEAELTIALRSDIDRGEVERAHQSLLAAVQARDGERARAVMEAHITDVQRRIAVAVAGRPEEAIS
jgi:GntR family transcriptional regulator, transcriptional repressor for pyruvate dehydrogenase complex